MKNKIVESRLTQNKIDLPDVVTLRKRGRFYAYCLPGYYEIWRFGKILCIIIDGVKAGKHWEKVELFEAKEGEKLYAGFHPFCGTPLERD